MCWLLYLLVKTPGKCVIRDDATSIYPLIAYSRLLKKISWKKLSVGRFALGKLLIVNGSPRAPRSNSKKYAEHFKKYWGNDTEEYNVIVKQHTRICEKIGQYSDLLLVFPLYADGLPVTLMHLLKEVTQ